MTGSELTDRTRTGREPVRELSDVGSRPTDVNRERDRSVSDIC